MRARMLREGSVGLFILLGIGVFAVLTLWLRGFARDRGSFQFVIEFDDVGEMKTGNAVRYRGVTVGTIVAIAPEPNVVAVTVEVEPDDLLIPSNSSIEANESGLVSTTGIDIVPLAELDLTEDIALPRSRECDSETIICNEDRLNGNIGVNFKVLVRSMRTLSETFVEDEAFLDDVKRLIRNSADTTGVLADLGQDLKKLTGTLEEEILLLSTSIQGQLGALSDTAALSAESLDRSVERTTRSLDRSITQTAESLDRTLVRSAESLDRTLVQLESTTGEANRLLASVNEIVAANRSTLIATLDDINRITSQLRLTIDTFPVIISRVEEKIDEVNVENIEEDFASISASATQVLSNLESLSADAAEATAQLRDASVALADPANLAILQQTLDSARITFDNTKKLTSDLEELLGDPAFRQQLRDLVEGLSDLVSSTQQLDRQTRLAQEVGDLEETARRWQEVPDSAANPDPAETDPEPSALPQWLGTDEGSLEADEGSPEGDRPDSTPEELE